MFHKIRIENSHKWVRTNVVMRYAKRGLCQGHAREGLEVDKIELQGLGDSLGHVCAIQLVTG